MYIQPTLFPLVERVRNTSIMSSSLCEYWNSARSVRWSFHLPSMEPVPPLPDINGPPHAHGLGATVVTGEAGPASGSWRKVYVGSGGKKASLDAMRLGQGGQQKRQQSSLRERLFIAYCAGARQEDHCTDAFTSSHWY